MKQRAIIIWTLLLLAFSNLSSQTVYITKTGEKYHTGSCRYLSHSKYSIDLNDALDQGYSACKVCKPTQSIVQTKKSESKPTLQEPKKESSTIISQQCSATTQKGQRCKRTTTSSNGKCWQHGG